MKRTSRALVRRGGSIQNVGGSIGGALAPLVTGLLVQAAPGRGFPLAFQIAAVAAVASGLSYALERRDAYEGLADRIGGGNAAAA